MQNTGQKLEELVRAIEEHLLPSGFKVVPRERVFSETGEQIAEFDIVISGNIGSSSLRWLIECRDRPSDGPAPGAWIEQLVSRRERFSFDKVFAVSSTGFAAGAKEYAQARNVVLRTVKEITDIANDFLVQQLSWIAEDVAFTGPITMDPTNRKDRSRAFDVREPMFKLADEKEFQSFPQFLSRLRVRKGEPTNSVERFIFSYNGMVDIVSGSEKLRVRNLRIPVEVTTTIVPGTALLVTVYSETDKIIWLEGQFEGITPKGKIASRVQVFNKPDGSQEVRLVNDVLPKGYDPSLFSVYGSNS